MIKNVKRTSKFVSVISALVAVVMLGTTVFAGGVLSDMNKGHMIINGREYAITPILIENSRATHTDNYYVPLRDTFEALGYTVNYDVDKSEYINSTDIRDFPLFENREYDEFIDENGEKFQLSNKVYYDWLRGLVTNDADYYIYGATQGINRQLPVIEMIKDERKEYCQIGSWSQSCGYAAPPVLIGGKAYIPLRAVANIVGGIDNVKWSEEKHDTYFDGALTFDENTLTVKIENN